MAQRGAPYQCESMATGVYLSISRTCPCSNGMLNDMTDILVLSTLSFMRSPPPIRTGPASAAAPQAVTEADPDNADTAPPQPVQDANAAASAGYNNRTYLKQSSTLSSISQDDFAPQFDSHRQSQQHTASRSRSAPKVSKAAHPPPQPPHQHASDATTKPLTRQGSATGNAGNAQHASNNASANARRTGLAKLSQAGQELYINQLKTLLTEAKEELKVCSTCRMVVLGLRGNVVSFFSTVG